MPSQLVVVAGVGNVVSQMPLGGTFRLPGGTAPQVMEFFYRTDNDLAIDLELMIRVLDIAPPSVPPSALVSISDQVFSAIRWQIWAHGHGAVELDYPPPVNGNLLATTKVRVPKWALPARGLAVRLNGRSLKVAIANEQANTNPLCQLSIHPLGSGSGSWRPFPAVDVGIRSTAGLRAWFPPHATEWRLQNTLVGAGASQELVDPQSPVEVWRWSMNNTGTIDCTLFAGQLFDWQPIPLGGHSWQPGTATFDNTYLAAEYR